MNCIFCKIARGELPCHKIYEDKEFLAFLDINPNTEGMTLVIPKRHYPSYVCAMPEAMYTKLFLIAKRVALQLDKRLKTKRTAVVMEGMGVDHAHIKLYPLHDLKKTFVETWAPDKIFFEKYSGYISTQLGPRVDDKILAKLAKRLQS